MKTYQTVTFATCLVLTLAACGTASGLKDKNARLGGSSGPSSSTTSADAAAAPAAAPANKATATAANDQAAADTSGNVTEEQMKTLLEAVAAKDPAPAGTASLVDNSSAEALAKVNPSLKQAFADKLAANPGIMTPEQADQLTGQLQTFITLSTKMDAKGSAAAWNTINGNLKKIKAARAAKTTSLALDSFGYGGHGLIGDVLGILVGYPYGYTNQKIVTTTTTTTPVVAGTTVTKTADVQPVVVSKTSSDIAPIGYRTGGLVGGVVGLAVQTVAGVLGLALGIVHGVLGLVGAVAYTAVDLVDEVFGFIL